MPDEILEFKIETLEKRLDDCATKKDLDALEDSIIQEIRHSKQLLKYGAIGLILILGGTGAINSDMVGLLMAG